MEERVRQIALKHALLNAVKHCGKAKLQPVLSKVLGENPDLRKNIREILPIIKAVVEEVNQMTEEEQRRVLEERWPEALEAKPKEEGKKELPPLPDVARFKTVKTRFAPNPDFILHLGSARPAILSYYYAQRYKGRFVLRFEDTDPKTKTPMIEAYDMIREDLRWLGLKWDEEYIQSLRMEVYYEHAKTLLEKGAAYICTHTPDEIRKLRVKGARCSCASRAPEDNLELWDKMLEGAFGEQEAVLRIKTDINHPDPSVRDWIAFRIIDTDKYPHPLTGSKYCVWPTYNFACGVDDHLMGITHILRAKEHISNTVKQKYLYDHFGWQYPVAIHFGRLNLEGMVLSKSKIREGIRKGLYMSWDDPRLATLAALRRRGILPETIWEIILEVGVRSSMARISLANVYATNRKLLEPRANRYMFVPNPTVLYIESREPAEARIPYHPSFPERGYRTIRLEPEDGKIEILISSEDAEKLSTGSEIRLLGLANIRIVNGEPLTAVIVNNDPEYAKKRNLQIIQWTPRRENIGVKVVVGEGNKLEIVKGVGEEAIGKLREGDIVQFYRFGFARLDSIGEDITFYFAHR